MQKTLALPRWLTHLGMVPDLDRDDSVLAGPNIIVSHDEEYLFDGVIGCLLARGFIPFSIDIALDLDSFFCMAALHYGSASSTYYTPMEIESFALLWNRVPGAVHGISGDRISLNVAPTSTGYPIAVPGGLMCEMFLRDGRFIVLPTAETLEELKEAA